MDPYRPEVHINIGYDPCLVAHELAQRVLQTLTGFMSQLATVNAIGVHLCIIAFTYVELTTASVRLGRRLEDQVRDCYGQASPKLYRNSKWAIVGMLAIWHAGGYLVPMEPTHPIQRLQLVAGAVATSAVLVSFSLDTAVERYQQSLGDSEREEDEEITEHDARPTSSDLAYILFTPGSTGTPKGVMVQRGSLRSSLVALESSHDMGPATCTTQFVLVYRTGDLDYYNFDGSLRPVGRKDAQVKLRGQRVELGGIEEAIPKRLPPSITVAVRSFENASYGENRVADSDDDGSIRFRYSVPKAHLQSSMLLAVFGSVLVPAVMMMMMMMMPGVAAFQ
ncbi:acetyl-CoA synthetase-like protein [Colletotrichum zoysiae]|uniref:Acetyl-CoA synthetase-like protein n=1 Tax=Colletotrichum zoysiae TaxID=1216348 RepID=A0AAD9H3Z0_9PEZI|nr:acetyl-CoA synthetase-like protein [Colletotrichum zoysiae]